MIIKITLIIFHDIPEIIKITVKIHINTKDVPKSGCSIIKSIGRAVAAPS